MSTGDPGTDRAGVPAIHRDRRRLFLDWAVFVAVGELVGFLVPAVVGVRTVDLPDHLRLPAMLIGGLVEGAVLGAAQAAVLRRWLPAVHSARWILLTSAAASVAYMIVLGVMRLVDRAPPVLQVITLAVAGAAVLIIIGAAQWLELRRHLRRAGWWLLWTAAAWFLALGVFLAIATPLWHTGQRPVTAILVGVLAGAAMAIVQAAVSGYGLVAILTSTPAWGVRRPRT